MLSYIKTILGLAILSLVAIQVKATPVSSLQCANPGSSVASANANSVNANSCTDFSYLFPVNQPTTGLNNWQYGYYSGTAASTPTLNSSSFALMSPTPVYNSAGALIAGANAGWYSQNFSRYWTALDAFEGHSNASYTDLHQSPYCDQSLQNCGNGLDTRLTASPGSGEFWAARRYIVPSLYSGMVTVNLSTEKDPRTAAQGAQGVTEFVVQVSGGVSTILGCVNEQVNGTGSPNVVYPTCSAPTTTSDPLLSNQPIYTLSTSTSVHAGDFIDVVIVPNYNTNIAGPVGSMVGHADFSSGVFQLVTINGVPEPATIALIGGGLFLLGFARRRRII